MPGITPSPFAHALLRCLRAGLLPLVLLAGSTLQAVTLDDYPDEITPDPTRFTEEVNQLTARDRVDPQPEGAIVGIGSSSMRMWADRIHSDLAGLTVIPRGFGGSHFTDAIYYAQQLVIRYKPRAILVYEGDNDSKNDKSPERIRNDLAFFVDYCRTSLPGLRVYVISVKPAISTLAIWDSIVVPTNNLMREYCEQTEGVTYIEVGTGMYEEDGELRRDIFLADGIHLNETGYDIWAANIAPVLLEAEAVHESEVLHKGSEPLEPGDVLQFDFGSETSTTDPAGAEGPFWNNITAVEQTGLLETTLLTAAGKQVSVKLSILDPFLGVNVAGVTAGSPFPSTVSGDSFFTGSFDGHSAALEVPAIFQLAGLPASFSYDLSLFPSRTGMDGSMDRLTRFTIDGVSQDVEAADNTELLATFTGLRPDAQGRITGEVAVSPDGNSRFAYLNAMVLEVTPQTWMGYPVVHDFVDTTGWLGPLYIAGDPWLYAFRLDKWVYLSGESRSATAGAWLFVGK